jgi:hypothetical protein
MTSELTHVFSLAPLAVTLVSALALPGCGSTPRSGPGADHESESGSVGSADEALDSSASRSSPACAVVQSLDDSARSTISAPLDIKFQEWQVAGCPPAWEELVIVTYSGQLAPLEQAGLRSGLDRDGVVSGRIALRDLPRLAALPSVVYIEIEPEYQPG